MSKQLKTRTVILEAALTALEEDPQGVNVRRIAQIAQCSRQAVYLHFANRTALLIALERYIDGRLDLERHTAPLRTAQTAEQLLRRYAEFLASCNPLLYPVALAVDAVRRSDSAVGAAWSDRLKNRRRGGYQIAKRLVDWGELSPGWTTRSAGDWLTAQASVKVWEELVVDLGYSSRRFVNVMSEAFAGALLTHDSTPAKARAN